MRITFIILTLFFFNHINSYGQISDYGSITDIHKIISEENKGYTIKVTLPKDYDQTKQYKTLYYLDSWWLSEMILGTYGILNLTEKTEDVVLVGITLDGGIKEWTIQRSYDFTPTPYNLELMGFEMQAGTGLDGITLNENNTGGADIFINLLETKIFKLVENKYTNLGKNRGILGHSFGGLFCVYVMQKKSELFSDFIIISPALWWNKQELNKKELFLSFLEKKNIFSIHLSCGSSESELITKSTRDIDQILKDLELKQLTHKFIFYNEENHISILSSAIYDGLLYTYGK